MRGPLTFHARRKPLTKPRCRRCGSGAIVRGFCSTCGARDVEWVPAGPRLPGMEPR